MSKDNVHHASGDWAGHVKTKSIGTDKTPVCTSGYFIDGIAVSEEEWLTRMYTGNESLTEFVCPRFFKSR